MTSNASGAFVISWAQVECDGRRQCALGSVTAGSSWRWSGEAMRIDGPAGILPLGRAKGDEALRKRAARKVRKQFLGQDAPSPEVELTDPLLDHGFAVTDGRSRWNLAVIEMGDGRAPLCLCDGHPPPADTVLWVVESDLHRPVRYMSHAAPKGVICFTPGTQIRTEAGSTPVEALREADLIQTKDNGLQPVLWTGGRSMSGARLHAMPHLAPVRIRAGALTDKEPDAELLVSPDHRMVLRGARARALFNCDEVLVSARDLIDDRTVTAVRGLKALTYVHLALPSHQIVYANGVETESFHPMSADLTTLTTDDRARLIAQLPELSDDPSLYGPHARRLLSPAEAVILRSDAHLPGVPRRLG